MGAATLLGVGGEVLLDDRRRAGELAHANLERPRDGRHWFTPGERALVSALAAVVVPSDELGPGAREADVVEKLDRLVAGSKDRQPLYAEGLLAFEELARQEHRRSLLELTAKQRTELLRIVDSAYRGSREARPTPVERKVRRARRKAKELYYVVRGSGGAVRLFPTLARDVLEAFYTSRVSWHWLGYDGPPFPGGYLGRVKGCGP